MKNIIAVAINNRVANTVTIHITNLDKKSPNVVTNKLNANDTKTAQSNNYMAFWEFHLS